MMNKLIKVISIFFVGAFLSACLVSCGAPESKVTVPKGSVAENKPMLEEKVRRPAAKHFDHYVKPGASIRFKDNSPLVVQPGEMFSAAITFFAPSSGLLTLRLNADDALSVRGQQTVWVFDLSAEEPDVFLDFTAQHVGVHKLMFHATIEDHQLSSSRSLGLAVHSGDIDSVKSPKSTKPALDVISLPAEEEIYENP